jgi:hypothetical protein
MNLSQISGDMATGRVRVVSLKSIAPLRLLRCDGHGGRWPVRWHVVYPDGEINPLVWTARRDAAFQASVAAPFHRNRPAQHKEVSDVGSANTEGNPGDVQ